MVLVMKHKESVNFTTSLVALFKKRRKELDMSHLKLAEKCGISRMAISHIEAGKRIPTIATCYKIAKALELKLSDVIKKVE